MSDIFMFNSTLNYSTVQICKPYVRWEFYLGIVVVPIVFFFNVFVLYATYKRRGELKQYRVYKYVNSLVLSNVALQFIITYQYFVYIIPIEVHDNSTKDLELPFGDYSYDKSNAADWSVMEWYAFRRALTIALFLCMSCNVVALTRGIKNSTYFVGVIGFTDAKLRISCTDGTPPPETMGQKLKRKICWDIAVPWLVPFAYSIPAIFLNCSNYCGCLPAFYDVDYCIPAHDVNMCSNIWQPLTNIQVGIYVLLWLFLVISMVLMLLYTVRVSCSGTGTFSTNSLKGFGKKRNILNKESGEESQMVKIHRHRPALQVTLKLLIKLVVAYIVCTTPIAVCFVIDIFTPGEQLAGVSFNVLSIACSISVMFCVVCPMMLIVYMPGLRAAIIKVLMPLDCTLTVETRPRCNIVHQPT